MAAPGGNDQSISWFLRDTLAMTKRNIIKKFRVPQILAVPSGSPARTTSIT